MADKFATVLAADGGKVQVRLSRPADFDSSFVEFIGTVEAPNQIAELDRTSLGNTFGAAQPSAPEAVEIMTLVLAPVNACTRLRMCCVVNEAQ